MVIVDGTCLRKTFYFQMACFHRNDTHVRNMSNVYYSHSPLPSSQSVFMCILPQPYQTGRGRNYPTLHVRERNIREVKLLSKILFSLVFVKTGNNICFFKFLDLFKCFTSLVKGYPTLEIYSLADHSIQQVKFETYNRHDK